MWDNPDLLCTTMPKTNAHQWINHYFARYVLFLSSNKYLFNWPLK